MVVELIVEGKREPMERRPNQHGDWKKNGYDDQRWPLIWSEINGRNRIRMGPTINRDFRWPLPLWVYEHHNRGAPRRRDNDNLQRGVFDEQDEFCPPFQDGDDFRLPQLRNIQQRQQQRLDYLLKEVDDFCFNY